jgi:hypothetical protein
LIDRLGLFGVRFCLAEIRAGRATSATELATALIVESGLAAVRELIADLFLPRADILKARTALIALRSVADDLRAIDPASARRLAADVERCEASTADFAELRLNHLVAAGIVTFSEAQREELTMLMRPGSAVETRLGGQPTTDRPDLQLRALAGVERWRTSGAAPFADVAMREACETMAHAYETLFVALHDA